jgi:tripartite-type tricarboxylate transporter receptor subunit TctC
MRTRPRSIPNLATLKKELGSDWTMAAWRAIAAPKGLPADVQAKLVAALKKVHDSKEFRDFMAARGFGVIWHGPETRAVHGEVRRGPGRGDEVGRHREVA